MSRVRLGNITTSIATELVDFYVAGIINSESGFLTPKMITDQGDVDLFFGDFPYASMYKGLISKRIPSVMLPIITPVSQYNRASIRINKEGSYIAHCHPRYKKFYKYVSFGEITIKQFGTNNNKVQEVEVPTKSRFHLPYSLVMYGGTSDEIEVTASYRFGKEGELDSQGQSLLGFSIITLKFSEPISGEVTVESYPSLESDRKFSSDPNNPIEITPKDDSYSYGFNCINKILPDIIVLDSEGNEVEYNAEIKENADSPTGYTCYIFVVGSADKYYLHYRMIPEEYTSARTLTSEVTQLSHQLKRYPLMKFQQEEVYPDLTISPYDCSVVYSDRNNCIISVSGLNDSGSFKVIFNVLTSDDTVDYNKVEIGEVTYSTELDFSGLTDEMLRDSLDTRYFTLLVNTQRLLFIRVSESDPRVDIPIDYFDEIIYLNDDQDQPISTVKELIHKIKIELEARLGIENVDTFSEECIESIDNAFSNINSDLYTADLEDWKDSIEDQLYAYELYLGSYRLLVDAFRSIYSEAPDDIEEFKSKLISLIKTSDKFYNQKLMVNYYVASKDLNYYKFDGLKIREVFNSSQDVLCSLTEADKVIEFYSKIKGPKGENTIIKIDKIKNYDYYYELTITNGSKSEVFRCYTYKTELTPSDAIDIRMVSNQSELVEIKFYDYELSSGVMIDQMDILDYMSNDEYDPNNIPEPRPELPLGTFQLKRITHEDPIYEDYQSTLVLLSESGFFPDLFLVPEFFTNEFRQQLADIYSLVRGQEVIGSSFDNYIGCVTSGLYSQALVTIKYDQLKGSNLSATYLPDNQNRMLYFFDDIRIKGTEHPSFYPYIDHIIRSEVLRIPGDELVSDPTTIRVGNLVDYKGLVYMITDVSDDGSTIRTTWSEKEESNRYPGAPTNDPIKSLSESFDRLSVDEVRPITGILDEIRVNYLLYNNIYYYYLHLNEDLYQPSQFIVQFNCSKISRAFMDWGNSLKSLPPDTYSGTIGNILSRLRNCLPYLESISCNTELIDNELRISTITQMKGMVNKLFTINYHLNIT